MKNFLRKAIYKVLVSFIEREKLMFLLANKTERTLLGFKYSGYLHDIGWVNSIITETIIDKKNQPLPWVTYPFISFIDNKLNKHLTVFEYGSGNSTIYYSKKVAAVDSVESDNFWFNKIKSDMPANVNLFYCELTDSGDYSKYACHTNKLYDIIIVDGGDRVNCCIQGFDALNSGGVMILDDSEREEYLLAANFLSEKGFKRLDFEGLAPTVNYLKCTTIFYRPVNCLNI